MQKLSIITPTLNCGSTLASTINSIQPLIAAGAEYIVVDSGSNDGTVELAQAAGATVLTYPKGNMYAAINEGMRHASGEWMTYINGDDLLYADAITAILAQVNVDTDLIYGNIDYIDEAGRFLFPWRSPSTKWVRDFMAYYSPLPQQGTLFRRRIYDAIDGFDESFRYSADYDFWVRALESDCRVQKYTDRSIAGFRLLTEQLSQSKKAEMAPEGIAIRKRLQAGNSSMGNALMGNWAKLYRVFSNLDSRYIKANRGRDLDKR
ncbi:MAG: glycosyltransferase family 2 protein [Opitutaceae bacterium]